MGEIGRGRQTIGKKIKDKGKRKKEKGDKLYSADIEPDMFCQESLSWKKPKVPVFTDSHLFPLSFISITFPDFSLREIEFSCYNPAP